MEKSQFTGFSVEQLLTAPLVAAAKANSLMALEQARFILEHCFHFDGTNYHPILINLLVTQSSIKPSDETDKPIDIVRAATTISLPLITLIPFSSLVLETIKFGFDIELKSYRTEKPDNSSAETTSGESNPDKAPTPVAEPVSNKNKLVMKGVVSYDADDAKSRHNRHYSSYNPSKMRFEMYAKSVPLPIGVTTMLDVFAKSIHPIAIKTIN